MPIDTRHIAQVLAPKQPDEAQPKDKAPEGQPAPKYVPPAPKTTEQAVATPVSSGTMLKKMLMMTAAMGTAAAIVGTAGVGVAIAAISGAAVAGARFFDKEKGKEKDKQEEKK